VNGRRQRTVPRGVWTEVAQPLGRSGAGGRLALADLVAVDDQHARSAAAQLACHREPREARAAHENVEITVERGALGTALGGAHRHPAGD
jgi:hypothetical protein